MDYKKIYDSFMIDFINTTPVERLFRRNPNDVRLEGKEKVYIERHHIIPVSENGDNSFDNLVELLPEEHIFIHFLRWKVFGRYADICAVNYMISGFNNKTHDILSKTQLNRFLRNKFIIQRQNFSKFIKEHNKGSKLISEARKGTMPVKDAATGEMIGSVAVNHPMVLNGSWVHHSRGRPLSESHKAKNRKRLGSLENPNAHKISNEEYLIQTVEYIKNFTDNGRFTKVGYKNYCEENDLTYIINFSKHRFGGKFSNFLQNVKRLCESQSIPFIYEVYYRSSAQRELARNFQLGKKKVYINDTEFTYK